MNTLRLNIINLHAPYRVWQKSGKPDHYYFVSDYGWRKYLKTLPALSPGELTVTLRGQASVRSICRVDFFLGFFNIN